MDNVGDAIWRIRMYPADCGDYVPNIMVAGWNKSQITTNSRSYSDGNSVAIVSLQQNSSTPVAGEFFLKYTNKNNKAFVSEGLFQCVPYLLHHRHILLYVYLQIFQLPVLTCFFQSPGS